MGKSSDVSAPDPRLVEAQVKSMGYQDTAIQQIMANANDLQPLQKEQMQFGMDTARTAYNQSQQDRSYALGQRNKLTGFQDTAANQAAAFNTEDRRNQLAGQAMGDVSQAFGSARDQGNRGLSRMGVDPNSGRSLAMNNSMNIAHASAMSNAANKTREAARQEGYAMNDRVSNMLSGFPAMSMSATGAGAGYGASGLNMANAGLAGMNSGYGAAGSLAGSMGSNASGMYGTQSQAYMTGQNAASSANGAIIGGLATVAGGMMAGPMGAAAGAAMFGSGGGGRR